MFHVPCLLFQLSVVFQGLSSAATMNIDTNIVEQSAFLTLVRDDLKLVEATQESINSFGEFELAFSKREQSTDHFVIVVFVRELDFLFPVGIQVEEIAQDKIYGRLVLNDRHPVPGDRVSVSRRSVVDWRYIDTWRLVGGKLYNHCESRLSKYKRSQIFGVWTQCVHPDIRWNDKDWQLTRDIVNGETESLFHRFQESHQATLRELKVDCHTGWRNPLSRREVCTSDIQELVIAFGGPGVILSCGNEGWFDVSVDVEKYFEPLMWTAATYNLPHAVSELLALGITIDEKGAVGRTALMEACEFSTPAMVEHLLKMGADPNLKNENGETAIFCMRHPEMAGILHKYGADFSILDDRGKNCLSPYSNLGRIDIVNALIDIGVKATDGKLWRKYSDDDVARMTHVNINQRAREFNRRAIEATEANFDETDDFIRTLMERLRSSKEIDYGAVLPVRAIDIRSSKLID